MSPRRTSRPKQPVVRDGHGTVHASLAEFDEPFARADAAHREVVNRQGGCDVAYYRDLVDAETALAELFMTALKAVPLPESGDFDSSLLFHGLLTAAGFYRGEARTARQHLDDLLARERQKASGDA